MKTLRTDTPTQDTMPNEANPEVHTTKPTYAADIVNPTDTVNLADTVHPVHTVNPANTTQDSTNAVEEGESASRTYRQRALLHASLLTAREPLSLEKLQEILESTPPDVQAALDDLGRVLREQHLGLMLEHVAQGYRLVIEPQVGQVLAPLMKKRSRSGLSQAALETLALIAYHQPVTRSHLEQVRGASCSSTLDTLQEHGLVHVVGHSDSIGKPRLYGTTQTFLLEFGLQSLDDLPALETPKAFVRS